MSQTAYANKFTAALAGQLAYCAPGQVEVIDTKVTTADILAGSFVCRDTTTDKCKLPATSANVTADGYGFVIRRMAKEPLTDGGTTADYKSGTDVPVLRAGRIWVNCETAAAFGGSVFVRFTVEAPDLILGTVRNDADTDKAVAAPGWTFGSILSAAGLVLVEKF